MKNGYIVISAAAAVVAAAALAFTFTIFPSQQQSVSPASVEDAQKYYSEGEYVRAIIEYQMVIDEDPLNANAYLELARSYDNISELNNAVKVLEKGISETEDQTLKDYLSDITSRQNEKKDTESTEAQSVQPVEDIAPETEPAISETPVETTAAAAEAEAIPESTISEPEAAETEQEELSDRIVVPDFTGLTEDEAKAIAEEKGITIVIKTRNTSKAESGIIFGQTIPAGVEVPYTVTLILEMSVGE